MVYYTINNLLDGILYKIYKVFAGKILDNRYNIRSDQRNISIGIIYKAGSGKFVGSLLGKFVGKFKNFLINILTNGNYCDII